jgi:hypothetical protein
MANARIKLSKAGTERLDKVIAELSFLETKDIRPKTLRIAFAKGISEANNQSNLPAYNSGGWEIPAGVIAQGDDYLLFKHLMIDKLKYSLDGQKEIDEHLVRFIEFGLEVMDKEIDSLSNLDNFILHLVNNTK